MSGWICVDFDGTLAEYNGWVGARHAGVPIPAMVERVKEWLAEGREVRVFTARVSGPSEDAIASRETIVAWCNEHIGQELPITSKKDYAMVQLWDDRCVQVEPNTGKTAEEEIDRLRGEDERWRLNWNEQCLLVDTLRARLDEAEEMLLDIADGAHYDSEYHSKKAYLSEDTYDALLKMRDEREARLRGKS